MPKYVIAYLSGDPSAKPQNGAADRAKWKAWLGDLGDAVINPGTPLGKGKRVNAGGVSDAGANGLTGFSVVLADNMDAALAMAQRCPYLDYGAIEVAEMMEMK
jgi:hypothetical protein